MREIIDRLTEIIKSQAELAVIQKQQSEILSKHTELLESQRETLLRNTITVEAHHKRSTLLEARMDSLEKEMVPYKEHVIVSTGLAKVIRYIGFSAAAILSVIGVFEAIKHFFLK